MAVPDWCGAVPDLRGLRQACCGGAARLLRCRAGLVRGRAGPAAGAYRIWRGPRTDERGFLATKINVLSF